MSACIIQPATCDDAAKKRMYQHAPVVWSPVQHTTFLMFYNSPSKYCVLNSHSMPDGTTSRSEASVPVWNWTGQS